MDTFPTLKGTRLHDSICQYEGGDEYYAYLVAENSSSLSSVDDLMSLTEDYIQNAVTTISSASLNDITLFMKRILRRSQLKHLEPYQGSLLLISLHQLLLNLSLKMFQNHWRLQALLPFTLFRL